MDLPQLCHIALLVFSLNLPGSHSLTKPSSVKLENNGYTGIVVAIHHSEPEDPALIPTIKQMITDASRYLYEATNQRAYFKDITILIPDTWEDNPAYQLPRKETFEAADVIIAPTNPRFAPDELFPAPYTKQYEGCGKQAVHIHFTSKYLLDNGTEEFYGNNGKVFVHEWGHFRWGLFNEYSDPIADPDSFRTLYPSEEKGKNLPPICTREWELLCIAHVPELNSPVSCENVTSYDSNYLIVLLPTPDQPRESACIMSGYTSFEEVDQFCDDVPPINPIHTHNAEAPNKHNRLCDRSSCWSVMRRHIDFKDSNNPPQHILDVTPSFRIVRARPKRIVLVLDTSGSMGSNNRISRLASSARSFVTSIAIDGTRIGIVQFTDEGRGISGLTEIDSDRTRKQLADLIPTTAAGGTCIGCGLEVALQILTENGERASGGLILLVTDGKDGNDAKTMEVADRYVLEGVIIDGVAFSNTAEENLVELQYRTGGQLFLQTDDPESTGLHDAFTATMETGVNEYDRKIQLHTASSTFEPGDVQTGGVYIDPSVGRKTTFEFSYVEPVALLPLQVVLGTPDGVALDNTFVGYGVDLTFKQVSFKISDTAKPGYWTYTISNIGSSSLTVVTAITSQAAVDGVDPIIVTSELSSSLTDLKTEDPLIVYAEVRQGLYPVIKATVTATVERPLEQPTELILLDNGAGYDITRDDGIYTRSFTNFSREGFYGIKLNVNNNDGEAVILRPDGGLPYSGAQAYIDPNELLMGRIPQIGNSTLPLPGIPLPEPKGVPAPRFSRGVSGGSSRVPELPDNWDPEDDMFAPNRILDLTATSISYDEETVTLEFTAPGDDLDSGAAAYYVIRRSTSLAELRNNYKAVPEVPEDDLLNGTKLSPGDFGFRELFVIKVSVPNNGSEVSYHFGIHAVDDAGNAGEMSNIVSVTFVATIVQPDTTSAIPSTISPSPSDPTTTTATTIRYTTETVTPSVSNSSPPVMSTLGTTYQKTSAAVTSEPTSVSGPQTTSQQKINKPRPNKGIAGLLTGMLVLAIATAVLLFGLLYLYAKKRAIIVKDDQEKGVPLSESVHKVTV